MFITIEGIDGIGKSTKALALKEKLESVHGKNSVILTKEEHPYMLNYLNNASKNDLLMQTTLFIQSRRTHELTTIKPALLNDKFVICDRYYDSTLAYQGYKDESMWNFILASYPLFTTPFITFLFDAPAEFAVNNLTNYNEMHHDLPIKALEEIRQAYLAIYEKDKDRFCKIDAYEISGDKFVFKDIDTAVEEMYAHYDNKYIGYIGS